VKNPAMRISGQSGCAGSTPPTMSWERMSLFTNVTFWPTLIVISSGIMPFGVIEIVGGPGAGAGGSGVDVTGGVGDVGVVVDVPLEQAAHIKVAVRKKAVRIGITIGCRGRSPAAQMCCLSFYP